MGQNRILDPNRTNCELKHYSVRRSEWEYRTRTETVGKITDIAIGLLSLGTVRYNYTIVERRRVYFQDSWDENTCQPGVKMNEETKPDGANENWEAIPTAGFHLAGHDDQDLLQDIYDHSTVGPITVSGEVKLGKDPPKMKNSKNDTKSGDKKSNILEESKVSGTFSGIDSENSYKVIPNTETTAKVEGIYLNNQTDITQSYLRERRGGWQYGYNSIEVNQIISGADLSAMTEAPYIRQAEGKKFIDESKTYIITRIDFEPYNNFSNTKLSYNEVRLHNKDDLQTVHGVFGTYRLYMKEIGF